MFNVLTNPSVSLFLSWLLLCSTAQQIFLKLNWYLKRTYSNHHCVNMHIIHREFGFIDTSGISACFEHRIRVKWVCCPLPWSKLRVCHPSVCVTLSLSPFSLCHSFIVTLLNVSSFHGVKWDCVTLPLSKMSLYHPFKRQMSYVSTFHWVKWLYITLLWSKMRTCHPFME